MITNINLPPKLFTITNNTVIRNHFIPSKQIQKNHFKSVAVQKNKVKQIWKIPIWKVKKGSSHLFIQFVFELIEMYIVDQPLN